MAAAHLFGHGSDGCLSPGESGNIANLFYHFFEIAFHFGWQRGEIAALEIHERLQSEHPVRGQRMQCLQVPQRLRQTQAETQERVSRQGLP